MTRLTVMILQENYPENIKIFKENTDKGIYIDCWLLKDGEPHYSLFDGGPFKSEEQIDKLIQELLEYDLTK
jgi:hypothetical protein